MLILRQQLMVSFWTLLGLFSSSFQWLLSKQIFVPTSEVFTSAGQWKGILALAGPLGSLKATGQCVNMPIQMNLYTQGARLILRSTLLNTHCFRVFSSKFLLWGWFFWFLPAGHVMKDQVIKHFPHAGDLAFCPLIKSRDQRRLWPD